MWSDRIEKLLAGRALVRRTMGAAAVAAGCVSVGGCATSEGLPVRVEPGVTGVELQAILNRAASKSVPVQLARGEYLIHKSLYLRSGLTLTGEVGTVLKWTGGRSGVLLNAYDASSVTVSDLVLEGRGMVLRGAGHRVLRVTFRNLSADAGWAEKMALHIADRATDIVVQDCLFLDIPDTGIIGWNLTRGSILDNQFVRTNEPIHLFDSGDTRIAGNRAQSVTTVGVEIQGKNLPGLVIEDNEFSNWAASPRKTHLIGLSIVAGRGAVVRNNRLICGGHCQQRQLGWGMEIAGDSAQVSGNEMSEFPEVGIAIGPTSGTTVIESNRVQSSDRGIWYFNSWAVDGDIAIRRNHFSHIGSVGVMGNWERANKVEVSANLFESFNQDSESPRRHRSVGIVVSPTAVASMRVEGNIFNANSDSVDDILPVSMKDTSASAERVLITGNRIHVKGRQLPICAFLGKAAATRCQ